MHARPTTVLLSLFWSDATMRISISGKLIRHLNETRWNQPAIVLLVPDKETSLVNHLQQIRLNPSEIILPPIWNICWVRLSRVHSPLSMQWQSILSTCTWFYPIQHTQLGSSSIINEVNVFRKLLVSFLGKSTLPIKKIGKCNGVKRAMSAVWNEQADQQLPRPH